MQLRQRLNEDNAVSPVIGVILMVAITVILAAVIASFVLGMGPNTATTPTATLSSDYNEVGSGVSSTGAVTITMDSGETLNASDFTVNGDGLMDAKDGSSTESGDLGSLASGIGDTSEITAGTTFTIYVDSENYVINLVYNNGDTTSTMQTFEG